MIPIDFALYVVKMSRYAIVILSQQNTVLIEKLTVAQQAKKCLLSFIYL